MKKSISIFAMVCVLLACVGCEKPSYKSLNLQRSALRGTADVSTTASFESIPRVDVEDVAITTHAIAEEMHKFLNTGIVGQMTMGEVKQQLGKIADEEYMFLVDLAIMQLSSYALPVGEIGAENIKRIDAFIVGVITSCEEYRLTDRPEREVVEKTTLNKSSSIDIFAKEMIKNHKK